MFVLPSRGQQRVGVVGGEGFGRVYVEAALAGKPVIGSQSGGASEAVLQGKTGFVVNPDSTEEVAQALLTIVENPELAARMVSEGEEPGRSIHSLEEALSRSLKECCGPTVSKLKAFRC